jgi:hypothetical protein
MRFHLARAGSPQSACRCSTSPARTSKKATRSSDGLSGEVEVVADPAVPKSGTDWYVDEFGGGILVAEPTVFGRVFVRLEDIPEDVVFVGRKTP